MHDNFQQSKHSQSRLFITDFGQYCLSRMPARNSELLQAWDAADEYALNSIATDFKPEETASKLKNFHNNKLKTEKLMLTDSLTMPAGKFSLVVLKVPKSMTFLEYQTASRPVVGNRKPSSGLPQNIKTLLQKS